jgi:hypothetical protein
MQADLRGDQPLEDYPMRMLGSFEKSRTLSEFSQPMRHHHYIVILLALLTTAVGSAAASEQSLRVDIELVIAVDVSSSMDEEEQRTQRAGYVEAFRNPLITGAILAGPLGRIAVTYVEWGGTSVQTVPWTLIDSRASAAQFARTLSNRPIRKIPFTSISNAIAFARHLIHSNAFQARRLIIDISGDGPNNYGAPAPVARNAAVDEGIVIDGLPIMLDEPDGAPTILDIDAYYNHCVIGGDGAFSVKVSALNQFGEAIRNKLVTEISGLKLSELPQDQFWRVQYGEPRYNCFIGEELQEHPHQKTRQRQEESQARELWQKQ